MSALVVNKHIADNQKAKEETIKLDFYNNTEKYSNKHNGALANVSSVQDASTITLGDTKIYTIKRNPTLGLHSMYITASFDTLTGTTGEYLDYLGLNLISQLRIDCGDNNSILDTIDYAPYILHYISRLDEHQRQELYRLSGGTGFTGASKQIICVIPLPWSHDSSFSGFPLGLVHSDVQVHVTFRAGSEIIKANSAGPGVASSSFKILTTSVNPAESVFDKTWSYIGQSFKTKKVLSVATATETEFDLDNQKGYIEQIYLLNRLNSDLSSNTYLAHKNIDSFKLTYDGTPVYVVGSHEENDALTNLMNVGHIRDKTLTNMQVVLPSYHFKNQEMNILHTTFRNIEGDVIQFEDLVHSAGNPTTLIVLCVLRTKYEIKNGIVQKTRVP